jgi:hypothetical protein
MAIKNGDQIKITWLPPCRNGNGSRNPYIGMSGTVHDLKDGRFDLFTGTSWLVGIQTGFFKLRYKRIKSA